MTKVDGFGGVGIEHTGTSYSSHENRLGTFSAKDSEDDTNRVINEIENNSTVDSMLEKSFVQKKEDIAELDFENQMNTQVGIQLNTYV